MAEEVTKVIKWSDLYVPNFLTDFTYELKYLNIIDFEIHENTQETILKCIKGSFRNELDKNWMLIPEQVWIKTDKTIQFRIIKTFKLENFQLVLNFIMNQCPYIYEYIQDQDIKTVEVCSDRTISSSNNLESVVDKIKAFLGIKIWLEKDDNFLELNPIILAALIQKFYQQNSKLFKIHTSLPLSRIKDNIQYVNTLITDKTNILKEYQIKWDLDDCVYNREEFHFLDNEIFKSKYFPLYEQNLDLKFLSYINCTNLKERARNAENHTNIL